MRWLLVAIVFDASLVAAERAPGNVYVDGGVMADTARYLNAALTLEGGVRLPRGPFWLHASGAYGGTVDLFEGQGPFRRVMAGVESEAPCRTEYEHPALWSCLLLGIDVGYQTNHVRFRGNVPDAASHGLVITPRIALSGVIHQFAVRTDFHAVVYREHAEGSGPSWQFGLGVALAIGYPPVMAGWIATNRNPTDQRQPAVARAAR